MAVPLVGEINTERLIHRFYGATMIEGKTYRVKTTMQEFRGKDATTPHSFEVVQIEMLPTDVESNNWSPERLTIQRPTTVGTTKLLQGVEKSYDSGKNFWKRVANTIRRGICISGTGTRWAA